MGHWPMGHFMGHWPTGHFMGHWPTGHFVHVLFLRVESRYNNLKALVLSFSLIIFYYIAYNCQVSNQFD